MVQVGDYVMIWIDSLGRNTTQSGYETLCEKLCPWIDEIDLVSDAGSGYKSSQNLLGLGNIKEVAGIRVRRVHSNDDTDIKVRCKHAMRAGQPYACCTCI
jgi:hypothetical protein